MRGQHNTRCVTGEFYLRSKSDLRSVLLNIIGHCPIGMFHSTVSVPIRNKKVHSPGPRFLQRRYKARRASRRPCKMNCCLVTCPPQTQMRPVTFESSHILSRVVQSGPHLQSVFWTSLPALGRHPLWTGVRLGLQQCLASCCWPNAPAARFGLPSRALHPSLLLALA